MSQTVNPVIDVAKDLQEGIVPSNENATAVLQKAEELLQQKKEDPRVNPECAKVLSDVQELAQATKQLLQNKNSDEKLQNFIQQSQLATQEVAQQAKEEAKTRVPAGAESEQMKTQARQVGQATLDVLKLLVKSGEFRMFLLEFTKLMQDLILNAPLSDGEKSSTKDNSNAPTSNTSLAESEVQSPPKSTQTEQAETQQCSEKEKLIPEERKRELSWHFISILRKMNNNPQFVEGMKFFQAMINDFTEEVKQSSFHQKVKQNEHVKQAFEEAKAIIQEFSGSAIDDLLNSIKQFGKSLRDDERMRQWLDDVRALFSEVFDSPHIIDDFSFVQRSEELFEKGRQLANDDKWKCQYENVMNQSNDLWESIKNDHDLQQVDEKTSQLMENFTFVDENGNRQFNSDLVGQFRQYIVPLFIELLEKIPIGAIEGSNEDYDYRFDHLVLCAYDIIPDHIEVQTRSDMQLSIHKLETNRASTRAAIRISNIRTKLENIQFWFVRKSFPQMRDSGVADLEIKGEGMSVTIFLELKANAGGVPSFVVTRVNSDIDQLNVNIKQAKHDILLNMWTTLFKGSIKSQFSSAIEANIKQAFAQIEQGLTTLLNKYVPQVKQMANQTVTAVLPVASASK